MPNYGLLGRKLSHSLSPQIHRLFGDYNYHLFEREPEQVVDFVRHTDWHGLNVTIPYKIDVFEFCDSISSLAQQIGSVNTLIRQPDGSIHGHNTDYFGFEYMLKSSAVGDGALDVPLKDKKVLILGNGGSARTVKCVLADSGAGKIVTISLDGEDNFGNIERHSDAEIIVNTTPVGMYPNVDESVIDLRIFSRCECLLDLIYNPAQTKLMHQANELGIPTTGGMSMLVAQAKEAAEMFLGRHIEDSKIEEIIPIMEAEL